MCLAKPFRTCSSFHSAFALTQRATQPSLPPAFESSRADQFMKLKIYRQRIKYYLNDFAWIKFISVSLTKLFFIANTSVFTIFRKDWPIRWKNLSPSFQLTISFWRTAPKRSHHYLHFPCKLLIYGFSLETLKSNCFDESRNAFQHA